MKRRNILVLEDNFVNMQLIKRIVHTVDGVGEVFCTDRVSDAYQIVMEKSIDLFLIDIILNLKEPGDVSGIRFIEKLRKIPQYQFAPVIIITQLYDQALTAFHDLHCYGYIEKPYDENRLRSLIKSALKIPLANKVESEFYYYRKDGILFSIECAKIMYVEAVARRLRIHTQMDIIEIPNKSMKELLGELPSSIFVQCHRGIVVNRRYIGSLDKTNRIVTMKNGELLDVGRKYQNGLMF